MMRVKLKDITNYSKGSQINRDILLENGKYIYLNGGINPSGKWNAYNVSSKTITISEGGNSSGYINYITEPFWCGAHCYYLFDGPKNTKYLYYALKSQQERLFKIRSGACMPNIKKKDLGNFEFEFDFNEKIQIKIVSILDECNKIINNYKLELELLDELVKARFVELFGDPATNEYNWPMLNLENVSSIITYGLTVRPTYVNKGIDLISARELHKGFIEYEVAPKISFNDFQSLSDKGKPLKNDILFSKTGSIGHCALVDTDKMFAITQNAARLGLIIEKVNPVWLLYYLRMNYIQDWCKRHAKGNAVKDLQLKDIKAIPLFECPLELQNQFADFVKEVDKSRFVGMMEYKKLGNICNIVSGGTPSRSKSQYWDNGNIPWIKIRDIKSKYIEDSEEFITIEGLNNSSAKLLTKGTVLYTIFATLGEVGILKIDACANQAIAGLTVKDETKILPEYLYYYLKSKKNIVNKLGRGVAQNNINLSMLKEFEIEVIDIVKQNNIIKTLNYVDDIIKFKSLELKQLDELVKARFVELFGTLDNPTFNYNKSTLGELCYKITDGKHGGCSLIQGSNRYFVGAREIYDDKVHYENAPEISVDDFEKDYRRCNVEVGDFLIVNTGATIGKSAIATDKRTKHTLLQKSVALLKLNQDLLNPEFLKWCYRINTRMYLVESSSAQPNLLLSKIKATEIYVPPIELQNQFADFVKEVDKSRFIIKSMIKEGLL